MKKTRKAFSIIEILLILLILGLLTAVFVPATVKIRENIRQEVVEKQIAMVISAGQQYNVDKNTPQVDYTTLVNDKYIPKLESVSGESYDGIIIGKSGTAQVKTSFGKVIECKY